jgi:hypothetical protein
MKLTLRQAASSGIFRQSLQSLPAPDHKTSGNSALIILTTKQAMRSSISPHFLYYRCMLILTKLGTFNENIPPIINCK